MLAAASCIAKAVNASNRPTLCQASENFANVAIPLAV